MPEKTQLLTAMSLTMVSMSVCIDDEDALNRASLFFSGLALDAAKNNGGLSKVSKPTGPTIKDLQNNGDLPPETPSNNEIGNIEEELELDAEGLPFDARIHTTGKSRQTKAGVWKIARNKDPELVESVKAELRAQTGGSEPSPTPVAQTTAPTPPVTPAPPTPKEPETVVMYQVDGQQFTHDQLIGAQWTESQIAAVPAIDVPVIADMQFPEFITKVTAAINAQELEQSQVDLACQRHGLSNAALLVSTPDKVQAVHDELFN